MTTPQNFDAAAARPPLDRDRLATAEGPWTIEVVEASESTNTELAARAATTPTGTVLVAEHQTAGLGRLGRSWEAPARSGLTFSILVRPTVGTEQWGWLALLAGVALREAVAAISPGTAAALKWPNDLLLGGDKGGDNGASGEAAPKKAVGILAQISGDAVIIGIGVNVSTTAAELPVPTATSIELAGGASIDRTALLLAILDRFEHWYDVWTAAPADAEAPVEAQAAADAPAGGLLAEYQAHCSTLGRRVRVSTLVGDDLVGTARRVDTTGRLILTDVEGQDAALEVVVAVGDVLHLRPEAG